MSLIRAERGFKLIDSDPQFNPELFYRDERIGTTYMEDGKCYLVPDEASVYGVDLLERVADFLKSVHYA